MERLGEVTKGDPRHDGLRFQVTRKQDAHPRHEKREAKQRKECRSETEPGRSIDEADARNQRRKDQQAYPDHRPTSGAPGALIFQMVDVEGLDRGEEGGFARGKPCRQQDRAETKNQRYADGQRRDEQIVDAGEDVERRDGARNRPDELPREHDAEDEAEE